MALSKIDVANMLTGIVPNDNSIRRPNAKPIIINGNQSVSQRTTSVTASDGIYCTDRIKHTLSNDGAATITQESLSSGSAFTDGFANAMKIDVTTADGSLSAAQKYHFRYNIEGGDIQNIKKGTANAEKLTLAFWVKATKTGTNIVRCYTADSDRSCSIAYTVSSSDTWEKKILNFPADTTGTVIADDNTVGMTFTWALAGGSNFSSGTLATAWASNTSANDFVGQVNHLDSTSNNFHITGIQLEIGEFSSTTIPPFQHESFGDNLARCQRYYYFHVSEGINDDTDTTISLSSQYNSSSVKGFITFPTRMRAKPSLKQNTGSNMYRVYENGSNATFTTLTLAGESTEATGVFTAGSSVTVTAGSCGALQTMDGTAFVAFDAEL
jgi:hypothetical protein